jgi:ADP-heptose:LPS heptosyltransferase
MNLATLRNVLIIKPSSFGDLVHTLPAVHLLKRAAPHLSIRWIANTEWTPLLDGNGDLDGVIAFPRNAFRGARGLFKLAEWIKNVERPGFDLALDFQGLARSGLLARFSGARRIHCLGDAEWLPRFVAHRVVPAKRDIHAVERYLKLVADLGVPIERPLEFPLPAGIKPDGLDEGEPYLLIHPFSRGRDKSIGASDLERLCGMLRPLRAVVVGRSQAPVRLPPNAVDWLNRTSLAELIWLIRHARFTVSVDSGPMHVAAALTDRLLGIHTWSDPRIVGPCHPGAWVWKNGIITRVAVLDDPSAAGAQLFETRHLEQVVEFLKARFSDAQSGSP